MRIGRAMACRRHGGSRIAREIARCPQSHSTLPAELSPSVRLTRLPCQVLEHIAEAMNKVVGQPVQGEYLPEGLQGGGVSDFEKIAEPHRGYLI